MSSPCDAGPWRSGNGAQAALEQQAQLRHTEVASGAELRGEGEEAEEGAEPPLQVGIDFCPLAPPLPSLPWWVLLPMEASPSRRQSVLQPKTRCY